MVSGKRTEFYLHNTNCTKLLKGIDEALPNQHKTGGQSSQRFERNRDEKIGWYSKKITELMAQFYVADGKFKYKGLIIAGPAEMKTLVSQEELFDKYFTKHLKKVLTIGEINDQSVYNVIRASSDVLTNESSEKELIQNFEEILANPDKLDLIVFGTNEVTSLFNTGNLKEIYIGNRFVHKQYLLDADNKTKIHIINSTTFTSKYGELVGIKYYGSDTNNDADEIEIANV